MIKRYVVKVKTGREMCCKCRWIYFIVFIIPGKNMLRNISWWGEFPFIKKGWGNF